jgi:hypothetical protein
MLYDINLSYFNYLKSNKDKFDNIEKKFMLMFKGKTSSIKVSREKFIEICS